MAGGAEKQDCQALETEVIGPEHRPDETDEPPGEARLFHAEFSGPLPPPSLFREYDDILPGAAERILSLAESEARHRQEVELRILDVAAENQPGRRFGTIAGLLVALALAGIALAMVLTDYAWSATIVIVTEVAAMVSIFVYGMRARAGEPPT